MEFLNRTAILVMTLSTLAMSREAWAQASFASVEKPTQAGSFARTVMLVATDRLDKPGNVAFIRRFPDRSNDVMAEVLSSALSPEIVALCMRTAARLEREYDGVTNLITIYVPKRTYLRPLPARDRAHGIVQQLRAAPPREVPGVGRVRSITVTLDAGG
jgi:hypothetical protein